MNFRDLSDRTSNLQSSKDIHRAIPVFDRSSDNLIEQKEFSETFTSRSMRPKTEDEIIMDEVSQLVSMCRCVSKYKVYHVGDGKYRVSIINIFENSLFYLFLSINF